ncbi:MAG: hypothetical protein HKN12_06740, partial [Gemmatimonadetes bacterium]|nr:hypothetical protein [Gemmatimonadota bacterium]
AFTYQTGTLKGDNSVATGSSVAAIYAAVNATSALTEAVDGDVVSFSGSTVEAGNANVANASIDAAANMVWSMLLTVEVN